MTFILNLVLILFFGTTIVLNHIFSASLILLSKCIIFLIFPVSDISQINIVSFGMTLFNFELIIAALKLRSIPGSSILRPRDIFE
jgi:hypothetical protein